MEREKGGERGEKKKKKKGKKNRGKKNKLDRDWAGYLMITYITCTYQNLHLSKSSLKNKPSSVSSKLIWQLHYQPHHV